MSAKKQNPGFLFAAILVAASGSLRAAESNEEFFEKRIRPVLVEHCYECHSAQSKKLKGGLRLDTREGLLKGGDTGPAIVAGEPEKSLLIKAVGHADKDLQMPPKKKLSSAQIADLTQWVKLGAPDPRTEATASSAKAIPDLATARKQWAYHKPEMPVIPRVKNTAWAQTTLDRFILARLEQHKLSPSPKADKRTLIRRATFDLIGLPPTPAEIDAFLADDSSDAFAKVVDRLLASPHYGERWGRHWLDVVRYADSGDSRGFGSEGDIAESWRYRDWVVNAFNRDLPYGQFIREQIAGDLMPLPKRDGVVATGMYAIGNWGNGDADKEKLHTDIVDDQIDVTGRAFLGLTLACARCHDHKFDPITTQDYYGLAGIFFSSRILAHFAAKTAGETPIHVPIATEEEIAAKKRYTDKVEELTQSIEQSRDQQLTGFANSLLPQTSQYLVAAAEFKHGTGNGNSLEKFSATKGLNALVLAEWLNYLNADSPELLTRAGRNITGIAGLNGLSLPSGADTPSVVVNSTTQTVSFITITLPPRSFAMHPSPKDGVAVAWKSPLSGVIQVRGRVADADDKCGDGIAWRIEKGGGTICEGRFENGGAQNFKDVPGASKLESLSVQPGESIEVIVLPKASHVCDSTLVELEISELGGAKRKWSLADDIVPDLYAGGVGNPHPDHFGNADTWRFFHVVRNPRLEGLTMGGALNAWIAAAKGSDASAWQTAAADAQKELETAAKNSDPANKSLNLANPRAGFWVNLRTNQTFISALSGGETTAKSQAELAELEQHPPAPLPVAHAFQDGGIPDTPYQGFHDARVHIRGRYDRLGDVVPRRFPKLLAGDEQSPITQGSGRVQLADWIASPNNPLTARVMVNRIWQHHFGEGIVRTPNNYGKLGTPPTHPELLDWLALEFIRTGWSVKAMQRLIMLSETYQQTSEPTAAAFKSDPDNLWFSHMNRRRLEAEPIRDVLLFAAGNIDLSLGGPSTRDLLTHRRTLYVSTVRSDRATYQMLFDAADPTAIVEKRIDSTVAPQALFLLNHPLAITQTKLLAQRVAAQKGSDAEKIDWLYQNLYGRPPVNAEVKLGLETVAAARTAPTKDDAQSWEQYCQILLCANEFLYID